MTSREIIGTILDMEMQLEWSEDEQERIQFQKQLTTLQRQLADKVDNIDEFIVELQRRRNLIQAEIDTYTTERKRLYHRRNAVNRTKDYLEKTVLPLIVKTMGTDGTFETDTARYTLYERYGSLEILDETRVPDEYKKVQISVDKSTARKALMNGTPHIPGLQLERVEAVRRS